MLSLPVLLLVIAAVVGSAAMTAIFGWLLHRINRLESSGPDSARQLAPQLEALQEELASVRGDLEALAERVDFTERLLENPQTDHARLPPS